MKTKISNLLASILLGIAVSIVGGFLQAATSKVFITIPWGMFLYLFILYVMFVVPLLPTFLLQPLDTHRIHRNELKCCFLQHQHFPVRV
jgi:hypothetical protein